MIRLGLLATLLSLLNFYVPPIYSQTGPPDRSHMDRILSGSFASGAIEERSESELVLVTWNVERGVRRQEIQDALRGPLAADLYLLQEIDVNTRRAGYQNVAEEIARELRMNYIFGAEFEELAQGRAGQPALHGQAVLSRLPLSRARLLRFRQQLHNWRPRWLPRWSWLQPRSGGRMTLVVEMQFGGQTWVIYNTHLESKANGSGRAQQMREILEDIEAHYPPDTPVIVAGDFNTREGQRSPVVEELRSRGFQYALQDQRPSVPTKVGSRRRVDWIFVRHLSFSAADTPRVKISDHYPVIAGIRVPQPTAPQ